MMVSVHTRQQQQQEQQQQQQEQQEAQRHRHERRRRQWVVGKAAMEGGLPSALWRAALLVGALVAVAEAQGGRGSSSPGCRGKGRHGNCADYNDREGGAELSSCDDSSCRFGGVCAEVGDAVACVCSAFQCSTEYSPVCGSNGDTYQSDCFMRQAACKRQEDISAATDGPCYAVETGSGSADGDAEGSGRGSTRRTGSCSRCRFGAECDDDAEDVGCVCNIDCTGHNYNPVCASDGNSYDNPCLVREASCMRQELIEVKYLGRCQVETPVRKLDENHRYNPEVKGNKDERKEEVYKSPQAPCPDKFKEYCTHGKCEYTYSLREATCQCDSGYTGHRCDKELNILYVIPSGEKLHYVLIAAIVGAVQIAIIIAIVICIVRQCGKRKRGRPQKHSLGHFNSDCGTTASSLMI
ncbi:LOW QUALITY PROTEIN: tomoregulin-1-like [Lampetra planeri]